MKWIGVCYRGHEPKHASEPTSGAGAYSVGGRFNPPGTAALYLACSIETMIREISHGLVYIDPSTICTYDVDVNDIVDLSTDTARDVEGVQLSDMACGWILDVKSGKYPASWTVASNLIAVGAKGILVPSFATGAEPGSQNLVLYNWETPPQSVRVYDPKGRLPQNRESWSVAPAAPVTLG